MVEHHAFTQLRVERAMFERGLGYSSFLFEIFVVFVFY